VTSARDSFVFRRKDVASLLAPDFTLLGIVLLGPGVVGSSVGEAGQKCQSVWCSCLMKPNELSGDTGYVLSVELARHVVRLVPDKQHKLVLMD
jgi:hypothetical protein